MPVEKKLFTLFSNSREDTRTQVVELFLDEHFGTGTGDDCSKYVYTVENYKGFFVKLRRPTNLNKGFDFIVYIDGLYFKQNGGRRHNNPSHPDIVQILSNIKYSVSETEYQSVKEQIWHIFRLEDFELSTVQSLKFNDADGKECPLAILLLAIRWLFIEQDITYWNFSGRSMLMNHLLAEGLA